MRTLAQSLAVLLLLATTTARAQLGNLCESHLDQDKQAGFKSANGPSGSADPDALETGGAPEDTIQVRNPGPNGYLQLSTNLKPLDVENISFPFDQRVTISYVFESAGASHALGFLYLKDAIAAGYVNANGDLLDTNNNGILDLHEALYNLSPPEQPERWVGRYSAGGAPIRRCNVAFTDSKGVKYSEPEIAMKSSCNATYQYLTGANRIGDARPGHTTELMVTDAVGTLHKDGDNVHAAADSFNDRGLFARIPNLLEPRDEANGNKGIGQMVFLLADDDGQKETFGNLAPVRDIDEWGDDGIPDYDVSNYDYRGIVRANNPDPGLSIQDRTVDLGEIKGGEQIVFFLIVYYDSNHDPDDRGTGNVFPCLKQESAPGPDQGKCLLHIRSPISVFFSKAAWNLDQNSDSNPVVAKRNIGCAYNAGCNKNSPAANSCTVAATGEKLCGWLDGPKTLAGTALHRLKNEASYNYLDMPMEAVQVNRPAGFRNPMPHVIVGAPTTDQYRWILGFEDIPGGGDRDFNDVVFVINKQNGGTVRSGHMSGDISPDVAEDFVITRVRFTREDDMVPPSSRSCGTPPCWTEQRANACTRPGMPTPTINYFVAVDCKLCAGNVCSKNPNPTWIPVEFPSPSDKTVELDMLALGFTGSQLCWKATITSPHDECTPRIDNINVGYQAVKSGEYSRSSPSTVGNAILWGVNETPGKLWNDSNWPGSGQPSPTVRAYDNRKDYTVRGRLYFRSLYDPEKPNVTNIVERWDAGRVMAMSFRGGNNPSDRKLYTMSSTGTRTTIADEMENNDNNSPLFPDSLCDTNIGGKDIYDLNNDGKCGTPSIVIPVSKRITDQTNDRTFLRDWLYGWEDRLAPGPSNVRKPWQMGGINLSTVAVAVPPYLDSWAQNTRPAERDAYKKNFIEELKTRPSVAYVGTMNGVLHAFASGEFRNEAVDDCASGFQLRGYFKRTGSGCSTPVTPREYGTGDELFSYMPRLLLQRYVNNYVIHQSLANAPRPSMDASPTIANVDFGGLGQQWQVSGSADKSKGAKTVLVSASGRTSPAIFALDITKPQDSSYPVTLWEFNLATPAITTAFAAKAADDAEVLIPDSSGSRHSPSVARLNWDGSTDGVWAAVVGTDYKPAANRSGALYILDMKTGQPLSKGSTTGKYAGVVTLDEGSGVAAETALVDLDQDGSYDVMYVPTTAGTVYRINVKSVDSGGKLGKQVKACRLASAPAVAATHPDAASNPSGTAWMQQIYSNIAVKVIREGATPTVRFYLGTADSPDDFGDGPSAAQRPSFRYHLMAFEDTAPDGSGTCALLDPLWVRPLDPGQVVWGGVSLSADKVYATTAVGTTADLCNLSTTDSGRYYEALQKPDGSGNVALKSTSLQGHGVSAPVVHDNHLFILTATGEMKMVGDDHWNNGAANTGATRSRVLVYDPIPDGRIPR
ncbi:DUF4114 domain-containing protein [Myxococcus sp. K15C18031901]|uniref:DUF4114 domain-containing protein n=1 Tax=Myxococcus dinghuensis TaxID=2906761 RepID=UPI0020A7ABC1|nr:DUF4114 domain-containing protein [Myxococcus dinghuensis]MCP3099035.1 DUF4114 domain-containing protein [Myxococcus dinghuensis]